MIEILIADDEPLAQKRLARMIEAEPECHIAAYASNGNEALEKIRSVKVDAVFMDVEMPVKTGIEAAMILAQSPKAPAIIFTTAYEKYAINAFEANAVDYLLKPVEEERLKVSLERLKKRLETRDQDRDKIFDLGESLAEKGLLKQIAGRKRNSLDRVMLQPSDIFYFMARLAEITAYTAKGEFLVKATLKELIARLDTAQFIQTHKAYLVNMNEIEKVSPLFSGNFNLTMKHASCPKIPLSKRFAKPLKARLNF